MTREEMDFIGSMNMCDEISNEAYRKIMIHCEEQEPCEDCISRQAAIDVIYDSEYKKDMRKELETLPPVTPQPKSGRWIEHPEIETSTPEYLMFYECSECGDKQCFCKSDLHKKRFCNNCGAKMEVLPYAK